MDMPVSGSRDDPVFRVRPWLLHPGPSDRREAAADGHQTGRRGVREPPAAGEDRDGGEESPGVSRELSGRARLSEGARRHPGQPGPRGGGVTAGRAGDGRTAGTSSAFPVIGCMSWTCTGSRVPTGRSPPIFSISMPTCPLPGGGCGSSSPIMRPATARSGSTTSDAQISCYSIDTNMEPPLPFDARERRLVVHGGGWGIGTFQQRIPDMESAGYGLDVVCYAKSEAGTGPAVRRYFMDDPTWRTWHRDGDGRAYVPAVRTRSPRRERPSTSRSQTTATACIAIIRGALGIVSKPGAGTLIDSFGSATPLIMLEPFGPHEERNAQVWLTVRVRRPLSRLGGRRVPGIDAGGTARQSDRARRRGEGLRAGLRGDRAGQPLR